MKLKHKYNLRELYSNPLDNYISLERIFIDFGEVGSELIQRWKSIIWSTRTHRKLLVVKNGKPNENKIKARDFLGIEICKS